MNGIFIRGFTQIFELLDPFKGFVFLYVVILRETACVNTERQRHLLIERSLSSILHRRNISTDVSYWTYEDCSPRQKCYLQR